MSGYVPYDPFEDDFDFVHWNQFPHETEDDKRAYSAFKAKIAAAYPVSVRTIKKARVCPITGQEVFHRFGISRDGWRLVQDGLEFRKRRDDSQAHLYAWSWYWLNYSAPLGSDGTRHLPHFNLSLDKLVEAMFNTHVTYTTLGRALHDEAIFLDTLPEKYAGDMGCHTAMLTERQAEGLKAMVNGFLAAFQMVSDTSFNRGSGWVTALAEGNLSIDMVDKLASQRAVSKQRSET